MIEVIKKFNAILSRGQKIRIGIIIVLMLAGAVLETASVSLIVPLMTTIMNPDFFTENKYAALVCRWLDLHSANTFMIAVLIGLIMLFLGKDIFLFFEYYVQSRFICNNRLATQQKLMHAYLNKPYEFYLNASTGEIIRIITADVQSAFNLLQSILDFFTEFAVSMALIIAIVIVDWQMATLTAAILILEMLLIYKVIKPVLRSAGESKQRNDAYSNKWILQSLEGIKEVKVSKKEDYFEEQYVSYSKKANSAEKTSRVLQNAPRLMIEAVTISSLLGMIAILLMRGRDIATLMPQLSAFAVAAVRLLPAVNRISTALNSIAFYAPTLDHLEDNLGELKENAAADDVAQNDSKISFDNDCHIKDVSFRYPNSEKNVLEKADMRIPVGKSIGIVGSSGAGKTTVVDILLGLLQTDDGQVLVDGKDIFCNYDSWLAQLSYIPQTIYMLDDTIRANVAFGVPKDRISDSQIWHALEEAQLKEFVQGLPDGLDTMIGERGVRLSGGQRQRIGIARALYTDPKLLIFDEATSALDNETEAAIMEAINSLHGKKTMIIIAHRLTTIEECDMIYRVENGKIHQEK